MNTLNEEKSLPLAHPVFSVPGEEVGARLAAVGGNLGKFGEIICRTCHDLHGAPASRLLRIEPEKTCELCHDRSRVRHGRKEISCLNCHPLHGMKKPLFVGENPARALCLECHGMKTGHPEVETSRQEGTEPLFNKKGKPSVKGIVTCPTCHDPHGESAYPGLVRAPYEGSSFLCLDCHRDKEGITLTPHDLRLVISENLCEPCHQPHFGSETYMWGVGNMEGSSMAEKLCGSCHREGGFAGPVSIKGGHPVDFIPPSKEGLPLPFFDTFWKENELGMVTCPTCHNVHGEKISALPEQRQGLLNLMYRFGDEVGYIERRNFCSICHRREKAIAVGPHREKECEECHPVHVKGSSEAKKDVARLCLSCHVDVPEKGAFVFSLLGKTKKEGMKVSDSAIFIDETGRISEAGGVSCPSCHDVHTAGVREKGGFPGGNPSEACLSCHPEKSALRDSPHDFGDDICGECHTICRKGFDEKDLREIARDFDANPADARCLICHSDFEEEGFSFVHPKKMRRVKSSYGAIVYVGDPVTMVSRIPGESSLFFPLFDQKGRPRENGSPGCLTCHDPHRDNMETKRTFFLRDPSGYFISAVCQPCHSDGAQEHVLKFHTLKRRVYE
ncbi:MAG: hypothetical protein D6713_01245 [Deltaproteobacteria bacterium]|nr:MAG: hypothetical protein D6713_01245 [Deltaproteobacteria bacterium]